MEEQDRIRAVVKVEADLWQTKRMAMKRHDRSSETRAGKCKAREGHGRIMPKKDMAELGKVGQVST